jgi:hypothetical protein
MSIMIQIKASPSFRAFDWCMSQWNAMETAMKSTPTNPPSRDREELQRRAREDRDRAAGNATSAAEHIADKEARAEMGPAEKLQERTDDLMRRMR